jgi:dihydropyrimidinase
VRRADVGIVAGRIAAVGENPRGRENIEADGLLVLPGGVDMHCRLDQVA